MSTVQSWNGDSIGDALAADFEGSLSCLGIELGTENYDMSAPLHSLIQSVSTSDYNEHQENGDTSPSSDSPFSNVESSRSMCSAQAKKTRLALSADEDVSSAIKRFCVSSEDKENSDSSQSSRCRHSSSVPDLRNTGSPSITAVSVLSPSMLSQMLQISDSPPSFTIRDITSNLKNTGFQYVLGAATSIATKINEETMTYLNQGQSYEIKLKKLGDLTEMRGKMLKSILRVGFQERRLQYTEKEQITQWQKQRVGERILEIDIPLSYGVYEVLNDPSNIHVCEFLWDPTNETGVFVRLNCISTEFTPKKHGGEKGAPFRIQIETFSHNENYSHRLHVASCQVKVFKPKGADRKHKTDREKMSKRPHSEQEKFKTSYDCTVFVECPADPLYVITTSPSTTSASPVSSSLSTTICFSPTTEIDKKTSISPQTKHSKFIKSKSESLDLSDTPIRTREKSPTSDIVSEIVSDITVKEEPLFNPPPIVQVAKSNQALSVDASAAETSQWLKKHGFGGYVRTFTSFSGSDILRLTRDDLIQICGLTDGIRLHNALHCRAIRPKLTLYVCLPTEKVFRAVYLYDLTVSHLTAKLSVLFHISLENIEELRLSGPSSISIRVNDEVVANMKEESMFIMDILSLDQTVDMYTLVLKPYTH